MAKMITFNTCGVDCPFYREDTKRARCEHSAAGYEGRDVSEYILAEAPPTWCPLPDARESEGE